VHGHRSGTIRVGIPHLVDREHMPRHDERVHRHEKGPEDYVPFAVHEANSRPSMRIDQIAADRVWLKPTAFVPSLRGLT
jgi:hypothetical protein